MWNQYVTCKDTDERLTSYKGVTSEQSLSTDVNVKVNESISYQTMIGFGGAFTEASAVTLAKMSQANRASVLKSYFDQEDGLGYNIGRVHIHSCDFALGNYTYVDEGDTSLESFTIDHDQALILPFIKDALAVRGDDIQILASPWSPPAWMKTTNEMNNGGKLLNDYRSTWANYYVKFIKAYEAAGIPIWGLTVQNEPAAVQTWDSCIYTAEDERDFVRDYLGPTLWNAGYKDKKLLIWDHNRDIMVERAKTVLDDPEAAQYVWGTGFHWYESEAFENVGQVHDLFPDKHLLFTEGCQEGGVKLGEWFTGERYARNMMGDFNNWCEGYLDWNLVLDETGGPNHVNNLCDAPIICDTINDQVIYNSSYYYIGHFSKFIKAGAKRIQSSCDADQVSVATFKNPDDTFVVVIMNESDAQKNIAIAFGDDQLSIEMKAHAITTLVKSL